MKYIFYLVVVGLAISSFYLFDQTPEGTVGGIKEKQTEGKELKITFLDIGQGDATYLQFGDGEDMLIDCAIDGRILEALGRVMPWNDSVIDYLVVTHPDLDHYGGCEEVLKRFEVKHVVYNGLKKADSKVWQSFWGAVQEEHGEYTEVSNPHELTIASTTLEFLYPDHSIPVDSKIPGLNKDTGSNDTSIVVKVSYGNTSVLLMGDTEEPLEKYLIGQYSSELDVDVLKLGHHGSDSSSSQEFLETVSPEDAVVSCGKNNKYGHPSRRVMKRLERTSTTVWRTDTQGDVELVINNGAYTLSTTK